MKLRILSIENDCRVIDMRTKEDITDLLLESACERENGTQLQIIYKHSSGKFDIGYIKCGEYMTYQIGRNCYESIGVGNTIVNFIITSTYMNHFFDDKRINE